MEQLPKRILDWLHGHQLSDEIIESFKICWNGKAIVIPVFDEFGKFLFNKYRKDPDNTDPNAPKYWYDKGSPASLYNVAGLNLSKEVTIDEGEIKSLALMSKGFFGVCGTSGAMKFDKKWVEYFKDKEVFICLDNDDAGIRGSFNIQYKIPWAKIIWLPESVGEHGDVNDYFVDHTAEDFKKLMDNAKSIEINYRDTKDVKTMSKIAEINKEYAIKIDKLMADARELRDNKQSDRYIEILKDIYLRWHSENKRIINTMKKNNRFKKKIKNVPVEDFNLRLTLAKQIPISNFIKFNKNGKANCIWHNEKISSLHYYENNNSVFCFSCNKRADVIDVIQQLKGLNLKEAIRFLLNS